MVKKHAIDVVAKAIIGNLIDYVEWESYPDIGGRDWMEVVDRIRELVTFEVAQNQFEEAYSVLEQRAKEWMAEHGGDS